MQKSVQVRTPLYAAAYWQQAADEFKNIRVLAFAGMVTALAIIPESSAGPEPEDLFQLCGGFAGVRLLWPAGGHGRWCGH